MSNKRWALQKTLWVGQGYLYKVQFSQDEQSVFVLSHDDGAFRQFEVRTGKLQLHVPMVPFAILDRIGFARHGDDRVFILRDSGLRDLDLKSGTLTPIDDFPGGDQVDETQRPGLYAFSSSHNGGSAITLAWADEPGAPQLALQVRTNERVDGLALSPDGRFLALYLYPADEHHVIDLVEQARVTPIQAGPYGINLAFSPDGTRLAVGISEALRLFAFPDGSLLGEDTAYGNNLGNVAFSPQGDLLLTGAFDGRARSYALGAGGAPLPAPQVLRHGGQANVHGIAFTRDGRTLATSAGDQTIKLWKR